MRYTILKATAQAKQLLLVPANTRFLSFEKKAKEWPLGAFFESSTIAEVTTYNTTTTGQSDQMCTILGRSKGNFQVNPLNRANF